jgi:hypothetical protein
MSGQRGRGPDFEDLVGLDVGGAERERLLRTHELLVQAGPPPELAPHLEAGPTLAMTLARPRARRRRRLALLAAAIAVLLLVFLGGYAVGNGKKSAGVTPVATLTLHGTAAAPTAEASLELFPLRGGNWPMRLSVSGLPVLPGRSVYEVYLVHTGKPWASCGTFVVRRPSAATTVTLNAPYRLRAGDSWVVTRQSSDTSTPGTTVLEPVT